MRSSAQSGTASSRDAIRQRELYKYFTPPQVQDQPANSTAYSRFSLPDSVLTAHVQLAAWRLDCQRAMLSLIDKETQYFIAESTKTLDIGGSGKSERDGDELWLELACTAVPKAGRLCEHTIAQVPPVEGGPAYFEVTNLRTDDRFKHLPFVCGGPGFQYYCGVPLRTKKGINIGSIFVLDVKAREPASLIQREVLAAMADNCMIRLKTLREKQAKQRILKMNMCLAAFVDPDRTVSKRRKGRSATEHSRPESKATSWPDHGDMPKTSSETEVIAKALSKKSASSGSRKSERCHSADESSDTDDDRPGPRIGEGEHLSTYLTAADLLKDSLTLEGGGGVVFLAPSPAYRLGPTEDDSSGDGAAQKSPDSARRNSLGQPSPWGVSAQRNAISTDDSIPEPAEVLASSLSASDLGAADSEKATARFTPLATADIMKLVKRHPRGKLFSFDGESLTSSSSSGDEQGPSPHYLMRRSRRTRASKGEVAMLAKHFPGARQIIFLPLWDPSASRWCACFSFNTCEFRYLQSPDFLHSVAFGNCIMAEISRIATMTADQQKSDFIGSVSHELRSPLHGILASCEFLSETKCDSFQKSLVDTADACARTLLDTLNMVLDYSKINHFERNLSKARKSRKDVTTAVAAGQTSGLAPLLNIYGDVDLAIITEEVVEGVASGQTFQESMNTIGTTDLPSTSRLQMRRSDSTQGAPGAQVEIIVDLAARDWTFVTQPGAFRRVVMNLFGNALKYTRSGFVRVKLEARDTPPGPDAEGSKTNATSIVLTIADSGIGISPEFMRTKLFAPFSQESSMNPGTGLGLSLVHSIVSMLDGNIDIQSTQNVGTEVRVTLPMLKSSSSGSGTTSSTPISSGGSIERAKDNSLAVVRKKSKGRSVSLFYQQHEDMSHVEKHATQMLSSTILRYMGEWFNFDLRDWSPKAPSDIVICAESDFLTLAHEDPTIISSQSKSAILVLCTTASRHASRHTFEGVKNAETLCHPFGPYKLAKALNVCLEHLGRTPPMTVIEQPSLTEVGRALSPVEEVTEAVQHVTLGQQGTEMPVIPVIQHGSTLGNEESVGAQMALDSISLKSSSACASSEQDNEFPFPTAGLSSDGTVSPHVLSDLKTSGLRPPLVERRTISANKHEMSHFEGAHSSTPMTSIGAITDNPIAQPNVEHREPSRPPRLLLVDDNRVNLRLLDTFMRKRKYESVTLAEDGSQAVAAFTSMITAEPPEPPDIIFMDISMPIMNGFEATRRIREVEAEVRGKLTPMETPASALIIALTGLASGRDQSEAFTSGFDLYLTKPVSMREVGRLLTNWDANGGTAKVGVPHGPVVGAAGVDN